MKKEYVRPMMMGEKFLPNEYVAACWGVGCDIKVANEYDKYASGVSHANDHCGSSGNQVIYDDNNDGIPDRMTEIGTDGLGNLNCTIYTDENYNTTRSVSSVNSGETIYWTTSAGDRTWHHVGTVFDTVPGHPNRS